MMSATKVPAAGHAGGGPFARRAPEPRNPGSYPHQSVNSQGVQWLLRLVPEHDARVPGWLLPWVVPLLLAVVVVLFAISTTAATSFLVVILVSFLVGLARLRVLHLKNRPPDAELVHKPFWKF